MTSRSDYDFVVQLRHEVLQDVQTRAINASLLTNLALTTPISRVIAQLIPPFQMKAHWDKPNLNSAEDLLRLSTDVRGGARHVVNGINLTMEGSIHAECRPRVVASEDGQPVVTLTTPSPLDLDMADLKLSYEGDDKPLSWVETTIEQTVLRPSFSMLLMAPLANMPLSYLPDSLPLRLKAKHNDVTTEGLLLTDSAVSLDPQTASLTLAMRCTAKTTSAPAWPANLLPDLSTANTAVALSERGLNRALGWLCAQGLASGTTQLADGPAYWRWTHVAVTFTNDENVHLTGQLWRGVKAVTVDVSVQCSLTSSAESSVRLSATKTQPPEADLIIKATTALIRRVFHAATSAPRPASSTPTAPLPPEKLLQRFLIPGTNIRTEAPATDLALRHGYLVALYTLPLDEQHVSLTIKKAKPKPTIIQPVVPHQTTPGAPVTVELNATLSDSTEPPYDYAWRVDHELRPLSHHNSTITVTKTPSLTTAPTTAATAPQKLATVSLTVIDILGQAGKAEMDATYYPAPSPQKSQFQNKQQSGSTQKIRQAVFRVDAVLRRITSVVIAAFWIFMAFVVLYIVVDVYRSQTQSSTGLGQGGTVAQSTLNIYMSDPNAQINNVTTGVSCTTQRCQWQIAAGTQVTLTATEAGGYMRFTWVGCDNATNGPSDPCSVVLNQNRSVCLVPYVFYDPVTNDRCRRLAGG
ncbi:MAG TPA: hypothetical protein VJT72_00985 [Pseudonocardiaceae bacterium]|nr:hypothetical protein [Pseudonocardiaceae bacterium]